MIAPIFLLISAGLLVCVFAEGAGKADCMVYWVALFTHSSRAPGLNPGWGLCVWRLHILPAYGWQSFPKFNQIVSNPYCVKHQQDKSARKQQL